MFDFRYFLLSLDRLFSISFASSQSRFSDIFIDFIYSRIYSLSAKSPIITGQCHIEESSCSSLVRDLASNGKPRGPVKIPLLN